MADQKANRVFYGTFIHSLKLDKLEYLHNTAVFVDQDGKMVAVERDCDLAKIQDTAGSNLGWKSFTIVEKCKEGQFFFPGFIGE